MDCIVCVERRCPRAVLVDSGNMREHERGKDAGLGVGLISEALGENVSVREEEQGGSI